ncbi:MAG: SMP-30/gluconolactonase/LRE family protein [Candidatus Latescibacteria bacterium]|nr:SMP-30/gluconolactonase/LRE family protein [Candidatus Latescibacterota bacterium]
MSLEVISKKVLDLIPADAKVERLATGMQFTEGPVWNARGGFLVFSDIPANHMKRWSPIDGLTDYRVPSGKSNGLTYDRQGRLLACEHANRRVTRTEADGTISVIASHYKKKKLNSPNDVIVKSDGAVYFSDPPYGLGEAFGTPGEQEQPCQGVYRLSPDGKTLTLLVDDFDRPNGLCFSPDESLLYINDTARMHIRVFQVQANGSIDKGKLFAKEKGEGGVPDGMKVDVRGNVYLTGPGGIWIFSPQGKHLGILKVPEGTANLAFTGPSCRTLIITATTSIYRVECKVPGIPV